MSKLKEIKTNLGNDLDTLSKSFLVILVFLRHFECLFCKEALRDLLSRKEELSRKNIKLVFVHMSEEEIADQYFKEFHFENAEHISDPQRQYYNDFGLTRGTFSQLFGLKVWRRGYELRGKSPKLNLGPVGDSLQMPGVFAIHDGIIKDSYIHNSIADRPDYDKLFSCSTS